MSPTPSTALHGVSLLLVEDDPDTRFLYTRAMIGLGAEIQAVSSVEAALAALQTWRPDVVLCDLHLPGTDGYGLLSQLRASPELQDIPVISISASPPSEERVRSREAGFALHLPKPSRIHEIVAAVRSVGENAQSPE